MGGTSHWIEVEPIPDVKQKKLGPRVFNRIWSRIRKYVYNVVGRGSRLYEQVMTKYFDCITEDDRAATSSTASVGNGLPMFQILDSLTCIGFIVRHSLRRVT